MIVDKNTIKNTIFRFKNTFLDIRDTYMTSYSKAYEEYSGAVGNFCPNCFMPSVFKIDNVIKVDTDGDCNVRIDDRSDIRITCGNCCGDYHLTKLDPNITWAISELNRKGYKTSYSCEGHNRTYLELTYGEDIIEENDSCFPYITFTDTSYIIMKAFDDNPIGDPWYYDIFYYGENEISSIAIRANMSSIDDLDDINFLKERIMSLNEWVDKLPYITKKIRYNGFKMSY